MIPCRKSSGLDVRPEPERVCPQAGCKAPSVGILLLREENGCAVMALISEPGRSAQRIVPWVGNVKVRSAEVPFREPPETYVTVKDFAPCGELMQRLEDGKPGIEAAVRAVLQ